MNKFLQLGLFFLLATICVCDPARPIIGIVAIPSEYDEFPSKDWSYFASSYVKYIESGGAQVVPLPYDLPKANLTYLLDRINGVFFTGGSTPLVGTPIGETLTFIVDYVVKQNKKGTYYPLWGTCMGFQAIGGILQGSFNILKNDCVGCHTINKNNYFFPLYKSRLFADLPNDLRDKMTTGNLSLFAHTSMFHKDDFIKAYPLNTLLWPVTTSKDNAGKEYISSFESPYLPIYGTQFHQEKSTFEWRASYVINHSLDSIKLQQYLARFFVNEARKNNNSFPDQQNYLIDNYQVRVVKSSSFSSIYFFPAYKKTEKQQAFLH